MAPTPEPVAWQYTTEPLSEKLIRTAERTLGVEFPPDYRACVRENHGGAPTPGAFDVEFSPDRRESRTVGLLLTLDARESENVIETRAELARGGRFPDRMIPIINDGGGNFVCLDYRDKAGGEGPGVAFWSSDAGEGVIPLAPDFSAFLAMLHE